jgi:hypothetical protein
VHKVRLSVHIVVGLFALSSLTMCQSATGNAVGSPRPCSSHSRCPESTSSTASAPAAGGYFSLVQGVATTGLPSGPTCATRVHRSAWEPRPENYTQNHAKPDAAAVHSSLKSRPRTSDGTYKSQWDSWLLPRVGGQFTGTTDEILQWAACKWGLPDNVLRAVAARESTWFQGLHYTDGSCYWNRGCGDAFPAADASSQVYCDGLAKFGHDYQTEIQSAVGASPYPPEAGMCPKTFSILGIMSWWSPSWGFNWAGNQNGAFPFNRDSTAFAADYYAAEIRGCYNGWQGTANFTAGDLWGCVGIWYSGTWHDSAADAYAGRVRTELANHTWLQASFGPHTGQYQCDPTKGCPQ